MQGFESQGMVLCAKSADGAKVEFVAPPAGAAPGERVLLEGVADAPPLSASQVEQSPTPRRRAQGYDSAEPTRRRA